MIFSTEVLFITYIITALFLFKKIGINLSLTSVLLCLLLLLHGPAYFYYTRIYGPETYFFHVILSAAKNNYSKVIPITDIALSLTFFSICIGVWCADLFSGQSGDDIKYAIKQWPNLNFMKPLYLKRYHVTLLVVLFFILLPFTIYECQINKVLLYIKSDADEFGKIALRREWGGSKVYLYNLLCANIFPFLTFLGLCIFKKENLVWKCIIFNFFLLVLLAKAASLSKAPPVIFLLQCLITYMMMRSLHFNLKSSFWLAATFFCLFILAILIANPHVGGVGQNLRFLGYRFFMIPNESLLEYFSAIPYVIDFSWGNTFSWLNNLVQSEPKLPTYLLVAETHRGSVQSTTNVMFVGDAWANFSWWGIAAISFIFAFLVRFIDRLLIAHLHKNATSIAALSLGHYGIFIALSTSFPTALLTGGLLFLIPLSSLFDNTSRRKSVYQVVNIINVEGKEITS